jgi:hypothetical protein
MKQHCFVVFACCRTSAAGTQGDVLLMAVLTTLLLHCMLYTTLVRTPNMFEKDTLKQARSRVGVRSYYTIYLSQPV